MARQSGLSGILGALKSWEGFLLLVLILLVIGNAMASPFYLTVNNLINMFQLSIEKVIVAIIMTLVIINGEIDLSVASIMGFAACLVGWCFQAGVPEALVIVIALAAGAMLGAFNAFWIAWVGIPSLVVTLATMIAFRGFARVLVEDRGITDFPEWFDRLGQAAVLGPLSLSMVIFFGLAALFYVILQRSVFGRQVYFIGSNKDVAAFSGVNVRRIKTTIFTFSGLIAALAGILFAARLGAVRGDAALGFELDIITIVLLGGVSIFGGSGTMVGTFLSILIVLNLRNGMALSNITGHIQTGVLGVLLILSVMVPNIRGFVARLVSPNKEAAG